MGSHKRLFSIRNKLILAGSVLAILLFISMYGIVKIQDSSKGTVHEILESHQPALLAAYSLKNQIAESVNILVYYLINDNPAFKKEYLQSKADRLYAIQLLTEYPAIENNKKANDILMDIISDLDLLVSYEEQVFNVAENPFIKIPAMEFATTRVFPLYNKSLDLILVMISDEELQGGSMKRKKLLKDFTDIEKFWINVSRGYRSYISYKNEVSRVEMITNLDLLRTHMQRLESKIALMTFVQQDAFEELKKLTPELTRLADDFFKLHDSEKSSMDVYVMEKLIKPVRDSLNRKTDALILSIKSDIKGENYQLLDNFEKTSSNTIGTISIGILIVLAAIVSFIIILLRPLNRTVNAMEQIAFEGNLEQSLPVKGDDEFTVLSSAFNGFVYKVKQVVNLVIDSSRNLVKESYKMDEIAKLNHQQIVQQKDRIDKCNDNFDSIVETLNEISSHTRETATAAQRAHQEAESGQEVVRCAIENNKTLDKHLVDASQATEQLSQMSISIGNIVNIINGITEQTGLLALNAAIEAARAGEQGRGFAVVADEVRSLSSQVKQQTENISDQIKELQSIVTLAVTAMQNGHELSAQCVSTTEDAGQFLLSITESVHNIMNMNNQVVDAIGQHHALTENVKTELVEIDNIAQQTAEASQSSSKIASEFTFLARQLEDLVQQLLSKDMSGPDKRQDNEEIDVTLF